MHFNSFMIVRRSNANNRRLRTKTRSQAHQLLEVKMRRDPMKRQRTQKMNMMLIKTFFVLLLSVAAYLGGKSFLDKFFFKNPDYNVQNLEVSLDTVMTVAELKSLTGLHEGVNIFSIDLSASEKVLSDLPEVKKAHVERLLPNTIHVSLERRIPIFRLVASPEEPFVPGQSFVVDQKGVVMAPKQLEASLLELPLLEGIDTAHVVLGKPIEDEKFSFAAALWNLLTNSKNSELMTIRSFDLSREYCALVTDETGARYIFGEENVPAQIERLQKLVNHCQETGRQIETANLILEHNTPVTFRSNSDASASKTAQFTGVTKLGRAR
ncbi:MAG: cell division protein FtsQ/DivIB [Chthoniobacterales bacterium]